MLRRHRLLGKRFHNEAVVDEVAAAVARQVADAVLALEDDNEQSG